MSVSLREGTTADIGALVAIENACFHTDRLDRRNFRWMLTRARAALVVAEGPPGILAGYILLLFRNRSRSARIYSVAVDPARRGLGLAGQLLDAAEQAASAQGCDSLHLEVQTGNSAALRLYEKHGYAVFGRLPGFYEDGSDALRMRKCLPVRDT